MSTINSVNNNIQIATGTSLQLASSGGLVGVTDGSNASSGYVGEIITSSVDIASAVSLTSFSYVDITYIDLTPGQWLVYGNAGATSNGSGLITTFQGWTNGLSATIPDYYLRSGPITTATNFLFITQTVPTQNYNVTSNPTRIYLSVLADFATGTASGYGFIEAIRIR